MNVSYYIAKRYFFSKKGTQSVNIILYISIVAIAVATYAMFVILSAFSGLEKMNIDFISNVNAEIKITPKTGKIFSNSSFLIQKLKQNNEIKAFSRVLEEKVYITYRERQEISLIRGIESNYKQVFNIDSTIIEGKTLDFIYENEMILGYNLAYHLVMPISESEMAKIIVPKAGTGLIKSTDEAFSIDSIYLKGVYSLNNEKFNNFIYTPIGYIQNLLQLPKDACNSIEIKLKNPLKRKETGEKLKEILGENYIVKTREEQDSNFLQMMNIEKLIIYLICTLIIIITTFNLASAIVIIILDKKTQTKSLISMGLNSDNIKKIFFNTGAIIIAFGILIGLFLGIITVLSQIHWGWFKINAYMAFPISLKLINILITLITVTFFGTLVCYISSRKIYF